MKSSIRPASYPQTRTVDQTDTFFGTRVSDPYRWLEDADDPEVLAWTEAQHDLAQEVLGSLPGREQLKRRLEEVWNYPKMGQPVLRGDRLFFTRNSGLQSQAVCFVQEPDGRERTLLDPNALSTDGTIALMEWAPSLDGSLLAYTLSESGEDWRTIRIRSVGDGTDLDDTLTRIKFSSIEWRPDGSGFFYSRFPEHGSENDGEARDETHQLWFHRPGSSQEEDLMVFEHPDLRGVILDGRVTHDGNHLLVGIYGDSFLYNRLWHAELGTRAPGELEFRPLFEKLDASYALVESRSEELLIHTTKDAPRGRIVALRPEDPASIRTVIAQTDDVISHATVAGGRIVVTRTRDAHDIVELYEMDGSPSGTIELPGLGSTSGAGSAALPHHDRIYIPFSSFLEPTRILEYRFVTNSLKTAFGPTLDGFDASAYETRLLFARSDDGTRVPVFVTGRLSGDRPRRTILYGYGGFDVSIKPGYASWIPAWLEAGGLYAVAVLRGGGEYGDEWHADGMFEKKQHVFDDFASAADLLVAEGITSFRQLAIEGGSNGGLLVAATMLQHPEKFGAVLCHVPVADMLRFQHFTAGRYWTSEYGDADKDESQFRALLAYSPVHNVEDGATYPPILIMSADHDDRVVPMHSKKLAARLQAADPGTNTILLRIETRAGHGAGKPTGKQIELRADAIAFLNATLSKE